MICAACRAELQGRDVCPACGASPQLDGRFELCEVVGEGATGRTYRAEPVDAEGSVAIKELAIGGIDAVEPIESFRGEASMLERLDHSGVPTYHDDFVVEHRGTASAYLVQEFIHGETLAESLEERRWTESEVLEAMDEVLAILAYLHARHPPVVHRDLKPANIMWDREAGSLIVIDFGSVCEAVASSESEEARVVGTYGYMAPEQLMGEARPASDVYALAVTAVALLSRRRPSDLLDPHQKLQWQSVVDIEPPFERLLGEMLRPDPDERLAEPDEVAEWIRCIQNDERLPTVATTMDGESVDLSETPRELPDNFLSKYGPEAYRRNIVGAGCLPIGGLFSAILYAISFVEHDLWALVALLVFLGTAAVPGWLLYTGIRDYLRLRSVYRRGEAAPGTVVDTSMGSPGTFGPAPLRITYRFEVDGEIREGEICTYENRGRRFDSDFRAPVLYDPEDPDYHLMVL